MWGKLMRRMYLEIIRMALNTIICLMIFGAGMELSSNYLQVIAILMWFSHIVAITERKTTWGATKKKTQYREEFPKFEGFKLTDDEMMRELNSGRD